eukprot:Clim_evm25s241 gene=Clim_evmTU25s241
MVVLGCAPRTERQLMLQIMRDEQTEDSPRSRSSTPSRSSKSKLEARNGRGETLLHRAVLRSDHKRVNDLIKEGALINVNDNAGWTPLHEACGKGDIAMVKLLLDHGADASAVGFESETPLHDAIATASVEISKLLLDSGASLTLKNSRGQTPKDLLMHEMKEHGGEEQTETFQELLALLNGEKRPQVEKNSVMVVTDVENVPPQTAAVPLTPVVKSATITEIPAALHSMATVKKAATTTPTDQSLSRKGKQKKQKAKKVDSSKKSRNSGVDHEDKENTVPVLKKTKAKARVAATEALKGGSLASPLSEKKVPKKAKATESKQPGPRSALKEQTANPASVKTLPPSGRRSATSLAMQRLAAVKSAGGLKKTETSPQTPASAKVPSSSDHSTSSASSAGSTPPSNMSSSADIAAVPSSPSELVGVQATPLVAKSKPTNHEAEPSDVSNGQMLVPLRLCLVSSTLSDKENDSVPSESEAKDDSEMHSDSDGTIPLLPMKKRMPKSRIPGLTLKAQTPGRKIETVVPAKNKKSKSPRKHIVAMSTPLASIKEVDERVNTGTNQSTVVKTLTSTKRTASKAQLNTSLEHDAGPKEKTTAAIEVVEEPSAEPEQPVNPLALPLTPSILRADTTEVWARVGQLCQSLRERLLDFLSMKQLMAHDSAERRILAVDHLTMIGQVIDRSGAEWDRVKASTPRDGGDKDSGLATNFGKDYPHRLESMLRRHWHEVRRLQAWAKRDSDRSDDEESTHIGTLPCWHNIAGEVTERLALQRQEMHSLLTMLGWVG